MKFKFQFHAVKWQYVVRYRNSDGRFKDRYFDKLDEAKGFFKKNKVYDNAATLFRVRHKTPIELFLETKIYGVEVWKLLTAAVVVASIIILVPFKGIT